MRAAWKAADVLIDGHAELAVRDELDTIAVLESPGAVLYYDGKDEESKTLLQAEKEAGEANGGDVAFEVFSAQERQHREMQREQRVQRRRIGSLVHGHHSTGSVVTGGLLEAGTGPVDGSLQRATASTGGSKVASLVYGHRSKGSVGTGGSLEAGTGPVDGSLQRATASTGGAKVASLVHGHRSKGSVGTGGSLEADTGPVDGSFQRATASTVCAASLLCRGGVQFCGPALVGEAAKTI